MRTETKYIVVHCSATPPSNDVTANDIRNWHKAKGWRDIGYHYVIKRDGTLEAGRGLDEVGAHVKGYNSVSVGICLVGGVDEYNEPQNNFTQAQMDTLRNTIDGLRAQYVGADVVGHRDFPNVKKACPCFEAGQWYSKFMDKPVTPLRKGTVMNEKTKEVAGSVAAKSTSGLVLGATALQNFLNSQFMMQFAGKKTYLMAIIVKLSAILAFATGDASFAEMLTGIGLGGGMATLKHGQQTIDAVNDKENA